MPRYRQLVNPETGKSELVEIGPARGEPKSAAITGMFTPFVSPIDQTVISDPRSLREHNKRHGVINAVDVPQSHYDEKRKEREREHTGNRTREDSLNRKREIYEIATRLERNGR